MSGNKKAVTDFLDPKQQVRWSVVLGTSPAGPWATMQPVPTPFLAKPEGDKAKWPDDIHIPVGDKQAVSSATPRVTLSVRMACSFRSTRHRRPRFARTASSSPCAVSSGIWKRSCAAIKTRAKRRRASWIRPKAGQEPEADRRRGSLVRLICGAGVGR